MDTRNSPDPEGNTEEIHGTRKRKTTRPNAGVPPKRLGQESLSHQSAIINLSNVGRQFDPTARTSSSQSVSGRSSKTPASVHSTRSHCSTVLQNQIDMQTEDDIDELEEQHDEKERHAQTLELEVKVLIDKIEAMNEEVKKIPSEQEESLNQLREQIIQHQLILTEKQNEVMKTRLDVSFEVKKLNRKKGQLRRQAEFQKQLVQEEDKENCDNLSQTLSDSEEEEVENEQSQLTRDRILLEKKLAKQRSIAEKTLQVEKDSSTTLLDDDELLIRLRNLRAPATSGGGAQATTKNVSNLDQPFPRGSIKDNNTNSPIDPFAEALARTFEKLANSSVSTDKFLARQVQGKELPSFSGRPEEWSTFITAFENTTQGCGFSYLDNLPRLQKCLKGEAAKTVQCLLSRPENVPAIMAKLKMRFGRPEHIVRMLITKAKEVPSFKDDRLDLLIDFGLAVDNLVETIKALNCQDHLTSPQLLEGFTRKLPVSYQTKWMEWVATDSSRKENLQNFAVWMSIQTEVACKLCPPTWKDDHFNKRHEQVKPRKREERVWAAAEKSPSKQAEKPKFREREQNCMFCDGKDHRVLQCPKFKEQSLNDRYQWVKSNRHCFCCLRFGHGIKECRSKKECGKGGCKKYHNHLLHQQQQNLKEKNDVPSSETISHAVKSDSSIGNINLMVLPVQLKGPKMTITTLAFLDPGASVTVIDNEIAKQLGLEGPIKPFAHSGLHPTITEEGSRSVSLEIMSFTKDKKYHLQNVRTVNRVSLPKQTVKAKTVKKWMHLRDLGIQAYDKGNPTILIGQDNMHLCNTRELILGPANAPGAGRTELGWVLIGRTDEVAKNGLSYMIHEETNDELHQLVKNHFTTEDFGVKVTQVKQRSKEDIRAQQLMDSTIKQRGDSWEIGLLWKTDIIDLPNTKSVATRRLLQMERKMDRDPDFASQYVSKINEYVQKGFARVLTKEEASYEGPRTFYLPHFMTRNPKKPKKLRFIFDAAANVNGMSLNDALLKGPDKLTNLPSVLFKFRQRAIGITADIKDMFHRVKVKPEDAGAQRFLGRGLERHRDPDVFEMGVLIFGAACSPACAQEVKNVNALGFQEKYPESSTAIVKNHYVDDYLDSLDSVQEAIQRYQEVKEIHQSGGFNICNWISNNREVNAAIPVDFHAPGVINMDLDGECERVLGLFWRPDIDKFTFSKTFLKTNEELLNRSRLPSKRELLSLVMSIFDPLGFLSLFTIKARILLQETWRSGIGWDDEIPMDFKIRWENWLGELGGIDKFQMERCYSTSLSTASNVQLHIFCDASLQAFGAVAYLRIKKGDLITVSFVASKAKVAPTKPLTVPRLELQAAVLGTRLANFIKESHEVNIHQRVFWSDSSTVISWIRADGKKFHQFVSTRIGEIQEESDVNEWRWIPTKQNVADEMTRDSQPSDWSNHSRWVNGPEFLKLTDNNWPLEVVPKSQKTVEELKVKQNVICMITERQPVIDMERFSSWSRLIRTVGYVCRFIKNCKLKSFSRPNSTELSPSEVLEGELWCIRQSQLDSFPEDLYCLRNDKPLPKASRLLTLSAFLDEHGIIRINGRIHNADVPVGVKTPIVLDPKHRFTRLLVSYYHVKGGHNGQERILNELRQKYHIIQARAAVKKSWNDCQKCRNKKSQPVIPLMGQLPPSRLQSFVSPFTNTGLDYFGPLSVTIGRRHEKRWVALFTCMSTRAVHLELAASLTTDSCIMAIRRFVSRRGCPTDIFSDNGTNFIGANNELNASLKKINQEKLTAECTAKGIKWHFIPPSGPHMGGAWERLVKSVKTALYSTLKESHPKEEVLRTVMVEAEHTVNSHPLTHVPVDPNDMEALTPNHFLLGRSSNVQEPGIFSEGDLCSRKQWRVAQQLANCFWKRWVKEYLPTLVRRGKWHNKQDSIKLGDIVLVVDDHLTRNSWPLGEVVKLYPGKDGITRVVDVRTVTGTYRRPVAKLCKLDVEKAQPNNNDKQNDVLADSGTSGVDAAA